MSPASLDLLMSEIRMRLSEGGDWCDLEKAQVLAALIIGLRPRLVVEIGVWMGGSLVPMLLALQTLRQADEAKGRPVVPRRAVAIDPWSAVASCAGQISENTRWWQSVDHDQAMRVFLGRLEQHGLGGLCEVVRAPSDDAPVPPDIDLLHVDGNHADQAERDVARFAPSVVRGGILVLDDLEWAEGHVRRGRDRAIELGFAELYRLGCGIVLQRLKPRREKNQECLSG